MAGAIPFSCERAFSAATRGKGTAYFKNGAVDVLSYTIDEVEAVVTGTTVYGVGFRREKSALHASCDCPFAVREQVLCKHIWALLQACAARGYFESAQVRSIRLDDESMLAYSTTTLEDEDDPDDDPDDEEDFEEEDEEEDDEEDDDEEEEEEEESAGTRKPARGAGVAPNALARVLAFKGKPLPPPPPPPPEWKKEWRQFAQAAMPNKRETSARLKVPRDLEYEISLHRTRYNLPVIRVTGVYDVKNGPPERMARLAMNAAELAELPAQDRAILSLLTIGLVYPWGSARYDYSQIDLRDDRAPAALRLLVLTGRFFARKGGARYGPLMWDDGPPWSFHPRLEFHESAFRLNGRYERICADESQGVERSPGSLDEPSPGGRVERIDDIGPTLAFSSGLLIARDRIAALERPAEVLNAELAIRAHAGLRIPASDAEELLRELSTAQRIDLAMPPELGVEEMDVAPVPVLRIENGHGRQYGSLAFDYAGHLANVFTTGAIYPTPRQRIRRDVKAEEAAVALCKKLGVDFKGSGEVGIARGKVAALACALAEAGWRVEAEGTRYRKAGAFSMSVASGIDWFEVDGAIEFDGTSLSLASLAEAIDKGQHVVTLADGSWGVIPLERLSRELSLLGLGSRAKGGKIRFGRAQLPLIDVLLSARPEIGGDAALETARKRLRRFDGALTACRCAADPAGSFLCARHARPGPGFRGQLRPYQTEGLAWLRALEELGLGGCLADDMGLGKTIQVLAHLASRKARTRSRKPKHLPSLVVAPRSVIFNWKDEAARFAPELKVLDFSGADRVRDVSAFDGYDLVLTTYGIVRSDAALLATTSFDAVILDESQAIKNASTQTAKAIRLLSGRQRLALTGTPIENHIGELWSLMEFLNPGLLGSSAAFQRLVSSRRLDTEQRQLVAQLIRPLLLRRTKDQVAPELPARVEQTIWCELDAPQKALYNSIRDRYRASLARQIRTEGIAKSKIHVLEALLRLRQAACHPRLIDRLRKESGVKFEALLPQLEEVTREGHKALVFSQFTELLALLRGELDDRGTSYAYLDGQSRDREKQVERFQTQPDLRLFLISLKAGGVGLNLTAADYVFLLDPWWNPAVEAQAIDRTHRIGQTRSVFAYRLVVRETVEEKILELQSRKRDLVESILGGSASLAGQLTAEDVERLLS